MCGIIGTYHRSTLDANQKSVFFDMLMAGRVRGYDGTGIFNVSNGEVSMMKSRGIPEVLMAKEGWKEFWKKAIDESNIIVGHHRAATKGVISDENSHPFQHGHITMVHNGTLSDGVKVEKDGVDSDALCKLIADVGWKDAFESITGPYACVWWDANVKKLFFIKNYSRPLTICKFNGNHFWASEKELLQWVLKRRYPSYKDSDVMWYEVKEEHIHWLDPNVTDTRDDYLRVGEKAVKKYYPVRNYDSYEGYYGMGGYYGNRYSTTRPPANNVTNIKSLPKNDWSAEFCFIEEEEITFQDNSVKYRYIGLTEDMELVFGVSKTKILNYSDAYWYGTFNRHILNKNKQISSDYAEDAVFYELNMDTLILIDPETEEERKKRKRTTLDGYTLTDEQIQKFIRERCPTCNGAIGKRNLQKILTHTDTHDRPIGLFCVNCSKRHAGTYSRLIADNQQVKH